MQRCWEESGLELEKILVEHTDPRRARVCETARARRACFGPQSRRHGKQRFIFEYSSYFRTECTLVMEQQALIVVQTNYCKTHPFGIRMRNCSNPIMFARLICPFNIMHNVKHLVS
jgi:hypothetical protein